MSSGPVAVSFDTAIASSLMLNKLLYSSLFVGDFFYLFIFFDGLKLL